MIPGQVCAQIPTIVNEKINSKAGGLPQTVALSQMLQLFGGALGLGQGGQPSQEYVSFFKLYLLYFWRSRDEF